MFRLFIRRTYIYRRVYYLRPWQVAPCQHGMPCPQVADGGKASSMEGSCEYIE